MERKNGPPKEASRSPSGNGAGPEDEARALKPFTSQVRRITFWLSLSGAALAALGAAGLIQAWTSSDQPKLLLSALYSLFILILAAVFFLYLRRRKRWYLEVENERLRERTLEEEAENSESICAICHKYSPAGMASCSMCGRRTCGDCAREDETGDEMVPKPYCPACWSAGEPFRERMLELEIACDERRERLEREWRESAERLTGGGSGQEAGEKLRRFDAAIGESFREKIVELELAMEKEKEAEMAKWREEALKLIKVKRVRNDEGEGSGERRDLDSGD